MCPLRTFGNKISSQLTQQLISAYLQVAELTNVAGASYRLLRLHTTDYVHSGFLHAGEEIGVVRSPAETPDVLPLNFKRNLHPQGPVGARLGEVENAENGVCVDY